MMGWRRVRPLAVPFRQSGSLHGDAVNLTQFSETIASLSGSGNVLFGADGIDSTLTIGDATSTSFSGQFVGDDPVAGVPQDRIVKQGAGGLTLTGVSSFTGRIDVNAGTLLVNAPGALAASTRAVTVSIGGTLSGTGSINRPVSIQSGGILAPGLGTGVSAPAASPLSLAQRSTSRSAAPHSDSTIRSA